MKKELNPAQKEIAAVQNFPTPKTAKNLREFLGFAGYYRRFINKFSQISKPLVRSSVRMQNLIGERTSMRLRCNLLCSEPVLQYPNFSKPFNITTCQAILK